MEGYSLRGQVLISDSAYARPCGQIEVGRASSLFVKGKAREITLYELLAVNYPTRLAVPQGDVRRSPRAIVDFPIALRRVESERIQSQALVGQANDLGYHGMCVDLPLILPIFSEVILTVAPHIGETEATEIHARALRTSPSDRVYRSNLQFHGDGYTGAPSCETSRRSTPLGALNPRPSAIHHVSRHRSDVT